MTYKLLLFILLLPVFANATPTAMPLGEPCFESESPHREAVVKAYIEKTWKTPSDVTRGEVLQDVVVGKTTLREGGAVMEVFALLKFKTPTHMITRLQMLWLDGGKCEPIETDPFHYPQALLFR